MTACNVSTSAEKCDLSTQASGTTAPASEETAASSTDAQALGNAARAVEGVSELGRTASGVGIRSLRRAKAQLQRQRLSEYQEQLDLLGIKVRDLGHEACVAEMRALCELILFSLRAWLLLERRPGDLAPLAPPPSNSALLVSPLFDAGIGSCGAHKQTAPSDLAQQGAGARSGLRRSDP